MTTTAPTLTLGDRWPRLSGGRWSGGAEIVDITDLDTGQPVAQVARARWTQRQDLAIIWLYPDPNGQAP